MKQHYKESGMKGILIGGILLVLADITIAAPVVYTSEALYLEDLQSLGYATIPEDFEDGAVWSASRSPSLVVSTTSKGLVWKSNFTTSTTSTAGLGGTYGFYSNPHGNATDGSLFCEPDENNFSDPCWQYDGWIITSAKSETLYGIGGWIRSSKAAKVTFLLDGVNVNPDRDGEPVSSSGWTFVGVIDTEGFTSVEILELDGADYDQAFIWGDSFNVGVVPAAKVGGKLVCPKAREGARLVCEVQLDNYGCSDVKTTRGTAMLAGNSGGTLFGMGIWGPFVRNYMANKIIPAGDAGECAANLGWFATTPGTFASRILIVDPVPAGIAPTAGTAKVQIELTDLNPAVNPKDAEDSISVEASVQVLPSL